jgi:hypothetical protein
MRGAIPPLPQYVFMAWCLVKHRGNFTIIIIIIIIIYKVICTCRLIYSGSWIFNQISATKFEPEYSKDRDQG